MAELPPFHVVDVTESYDYRTARVTSSAIREGVVYMTISFQVPIEFIDIGAVKYAPAAERVHVGTIITPNLIEDRGWNPGLYQPDGEDGPPIRIGGGREGSSQVGVQGGACQSAAFVPIQSPAGPKGN